MKLWQQVLDIWAYRNIFEQIDRLSFDPKLKNVVFHIIINSFLSFPSIYRSFKKSCFLSIKISVNNWFLFVCRYEFDVFILVTTFTIIIIKEGIQDSQIPANVQLFQHSHWQGFCVEPALELSGNPVLAHFPAQTNFKVF